MNICVAQWRVPLGAHDVVLTFLHPTGKPLSFDEIDDLAEIVAFFRRQFVRNRKGPDVFPILFPLL